MKVKMHHRGFTLIEVIVAIGIFALLGAGTYKVVSGMSASRERVELHSERIAEVVRAVRIIDDDMRQLADRKIRDGSSEVLPAVKADVFSGGDDSAVVEFSRIGRRNPLLAKRSETVRVAYYYQDEWEEAEENQKSEKKEDQEDKSGVLVRAVWPVLDRPDDDLEMDRQLLLGGIEKISMEYLDSENIWRDSWPPLGNNGQKSEELPFSIKILIDTKDYGGIERYYAIRKIPEKL